MRENGVGEFLFRSAGAAGAIGWTVVAPSVYITIQEGPTQSQKDIQRIEGMFSHDATEQDTAQQIKLQYAEAARDDDEPIVIQALGSLSLDQGTNAACNPKHPLKPGDNLWDIITQEGYVGDDGKRISTHDLAVANGIDDERYIHDYGYILGKCPGSAPQPTPDDGKNHTAASSGDTTGSVIIGIGFLLVTGLGLAAGASKIKPAQR